MRHLRINTWKNGLLKSIFLAVLAGLIITSDTPKKTREEYVLEEIVSSSHRGMAETNPSISTNFFRKVKDIAITNTKIGLAGFYIFTSIIVKNMKILGEGYKGFIEGISQGFSREYLGKRLEENREDKDQWEEGMFRYVDSVLISYEDYEKKKYFITPLQLLEYPAILDSLPLREGERVVIVDKEKQELRVYEKVRFVELLRAKTSTGRNPGNKERKGDNKTPEGMFNIISIENSENWLFNGRHAYGPFFLRLNTGSWDSKGRYNPNGRSSIGVHGTDEPEFLGHRRSHGCIRIHSNAVRKGVERDLFYKGERVIISKTVF